jgi:hypothetical protein
MCCQANARCKLTWEEAFAADLAAYLAAFFSSAFFAPDGRQIWG